MLEWLAKISKFVVEHEELLGTLIKAVEGGTPRDALMKAIKSAMVEASDAQMHRELDGGK